MKKLFLLFCFAMVAYMAEARPHFTPDDAFPLYSRQNDADRYRIGTSRRALANSVPSFDMTLNEKAYSVADSTIEYSVCKDDKWVKLQFVASGRTRTAYTPIEYVTVEYYELPEYRTSDGLAAYKLTADTDFDEWGRGTLETTIDAGEVVIVQRINDNGSVVCEYAGRNWFTYHGDHLVPTDKPYKYTYPLLSSPSVGGFLVKLLQFALWLLPTIVLAIILSRIYLKRYRDKGEKKSWLDYIAGLLVVATVVLLYFAYGNIIHRSLFDDMFAFSMYFNKWWQVALLGSLVVVVANFALGLVIRFSRMAPSIQFAVLQYAMIVVAWNACAACFTFSWIWGIIGSVIIVMIWACSFFPAALIALQPDKHCDVCHACGSHVVEKEFDGNLHRRDRHGKPIEIEYKNDVIVGKQYACKRCGHEWIVLRDSGYSKMKLAVENRFTDCSTIQLMHE